ncbi:MAG: DUF2505 domain-containing protein [Actinomycetota bacterium]|nr:DUF2505 domain-containing protein [Actinomycetota bacterium]
MRLQAVLRYPAEPARVVAMLADPEFSRRVIAATQGKAEAVDVTGDASGVGAFTVTTRRSVPTDQIPAQMRSFVGASLDVRQATAWGAEEDGIRRGSVALEIAGAPVRVTGTTHLVATPEGSTVLEYDTQVRAQVPLFASAIEEAAAGAVRHALETEERVALDWLAEH